MATGPPRAATSLKPRPASGDRQSLLGQAGPRGACSCRHMEVRHRRRVEGGALEQRPRQHHREVRARHSRGARLQRLAAFQRATGPTGRSSGTIRFRARVLVVLVSLLECEEADGRQPVPRAVRARLMRAMRVTSGVWGWDQG